METADFTTDEFLGGKLKIKQPAKGYRIGIDTVLLASATKPWDNAKVWIWAAGSAEFRYACYPITQTFLLLELILMVI